MNMRRDRVLLAVGEVGVMAQRSARTEFLDLWDAEFRVFSQWGEDGILTYICDILKIDKPKFLEVGIGDYIECNSRFLAETRGASVYAVDMSPAAAINIEHMELSWRTTIKFEHNLVTPKNINEVVFRAKSQLGGLDLFSLDIDGNDYWVLSAMDLTGLRGLVVEYNPLFGSRLAVTIPESDQFDRFHAHHSGLYWGASIRAFIQLLESRGFIFVGTNRANNNAFFINKTEISSWKLPLPDQASLDRYTDWRVNDARNEDGKITNLATEAKVEILENLPLWDIDHEVVVYADFRLLSE